MGVAERVRDLVAPLVEAERLELFDVEFAAGRLRILVDREGGVDLDALTRATHRISAALDHADPVPGGRYVLEVSSPGLERPLRTPEHFRRSVGAEVAVKTHAHVEGDRRAQGVLTAADDDGFTLGGRRFSYGDVERARTVFTWGPGQREKPGNRNKGKGRRTEGHAAAARRAPERVPGS
jgi:ribosome maturation factor RimP